MAKNNKIDWTAFFNNYNCSGYLKDEQVFFDLVFEYSQDIAFCAACSKTKSMKNGIPREFYVSARLQRFYKYCDAYKLDYGILSDMYGIHWKEENLDYYDMHPSKLNLNDFINLGSLISEKCKDRSISILIFYGPSPLMSRPYFKMLYHSGIKYFYISKLLKKQSIKTIL